MKRTHPQALRLLGFALALLATAAITAETKAAFTERAGATPADYAERVANESGDGSIETLRDRAQVYPYRCTFTGLLAPRQRVQALCFLPLDRNVDQLTPLPIVQVATGSVWITSHLVGGHYKPRHVRVVLSNDSHAAVPLAATVDVY